MRAPYSILIKVAAMRTEDEVNAYRRSTRAKAVQRCKCIESCRCSENADLRAKLYESCIPRDFWFLEDEEVKLNVEVYNKTIKKYIKKLDVAFRYGYGLLFSGDNGVGKTTFISLVLKAAMARGLSAYYTTLPDLLYDLNKGFRDREIAQRIEWCLSSDFVAIDEIGKDKNKNKIFSAEFHFERLLKKRFDDATPTLLASNMSLKEMKAAYGKTVYSMLLGKYHVTAMKEGDFRGELRKRMNETMGYDKV